MSRGGSVLAWRGHSLIALAARLYLAGVFLFACWHKILHPAAFAVDVATYGILPLQLVNQLAITLPWVELAAGLMLIAGFRARAGALLVAGMMTMFIAALAIALHRHLDISCGCFASQGAKHDPISWKTLVRDGTWLVLSAYVLIFDRRPLGLDRLLGRAEAQGQAPRPIPDEANP